MLRAYVRGYGPVTQRDAAWWTGMDLKRVRRAMDALEDELVEIALKGHEDTWLMHAADAEELERAALLDQPSVAVLPANDPLMIGYTDRSRFIDDVARPLRLRQLAQCSTGRARQRENRGRVGRDARPQPPRETARRPFFSRSHPSTPKRSTSSSEALVGIASPAAADPTPVRHVSAMRSLAARPIGSFAHPLR